MLECIEIKVGNNKTMVLKDDILMEKDMSLKKDKESLVSDVIITVLVFMIFGKTMGKLAVINTVVNRAVKIFF